MICDFLPAAEEDLWDQPLLGLHNGHDYATWPKIACTCQPLHLSRSYPTINIHQRARAYYCLAPALLEGVTSSRLLGSFKSRESLNLPLSPECTRAASRTGCCKRSPCQMPHPGVSPDLVQLSTHPSTDGCFVGHLHRYRPAGSSIHRFFVRFHQGLQGHGQSPRRPPVQPSELVGWPECG